MSLRVVFVLQLRALFLLLTIRHVVGLMAVSRVDPLGLGQNACRLYVPKGINWVKVQCRWVYLRDWHTLLQEHAFAARVRGLTAVPVA